MRNNNITVLKKAIRLADLNGLKTTIIEVTDLVELHNEISRLNAKLESVNRELHRRETRAKDVLKQMEKTKAIKAYTFNELKDAVE